MIIPNNKKLEFPTGFLWGAATSAYQVEGGIHGADWSKTHPSGRACEHYRLYKKDFDILEKLNLNAYRFSIEWSRIQPEPDQWNAEAIEHYRTYLEELKARGIKTMATLHHFTTPLWVTRQGGWANKKIVSSFPRFAQKMFQEYNDLVDFWVTINEPVSVYALMSYLTGEWPPHRKNPVLFLKVIQNQIRAHKKIYNAFHQQDPGCRVGIAKHNTYFEPLSGSLLDKIPVEAARYFSNFFFLNRVKDHLDYIGVNYYCHARLQFPARLRNENLITTAMGWEIFPRGIYHVLQELDKYKLPIYITENGVADREDKHREEFIKDHLYWTHKAIKQGVDVRGYFYWSLIDNFEWAHGFGPRFGLAEVDYQTMERKLRSSAYYLAKTAENNALYV